MSRFSVGNCLSHNAENIVAELICFRYVLELKIFWIIAVSRFCCFFLSHIAEKHRGRTLLCFRFVLVPNFLDNKGITNLLIVCVSQCRKFCGELFNDSNKLGRPKILCIIGEFHDFTLINFSLTKSKNFVGERFGVSKDLGYRNF